MVMGTIKKGGSGCICPASTMLKALMTHLVLLHQEVLLLDMEAGLEHLGRGTSRGVDFLIVVVEPGRRSVDTAGHIKALASDLGLSRILIVGNKVRGDKDRAFLEKALAGFDFLGSLPYDDEIIEADLNNVSPASIAGQALAAVGEMADKLLNLKENSPKSQTA